jgi:hypothetical protein
VAVPETISSTRLTASTSSDYAGDGREQLVAGKRPCLRASLPEHLGPRKSFLGGGRARAAERGHHLGMGEDQFVGSHPEALERAATAAGRGQRRGPR